MRLVLTVCIVLFWMGPVQADFLYEYETRAEVPDLHSYEFSWSFTSDELLTESTNVGVGDLLTWSTTDISDIFDVQIINPSTQLPRVRTTFVGPGVTSVVDSYDTPFDGPGSWYLGGEELSFESLFVITERPTDQAPVPEPATMLLFGTGLAGLAGYRKRKAMKK